MNKQALTFAAIIILVTLGIILFTGNDDPANPAGTAPADSDQVTENDTELSEGYTRSGTVIFSDAGLDMSAIELAAPATLTVRNQTENPVVITNADTGLELGVAGEFSDALITFEQVGTYQVMVGANAMITVTVVEVDESLIVDDVPLSDRLDDLESDSPATDKL